MTAPATYRRTVFAETVRIGDVLLDRYGEVTGRGRTPVLAVSVNRRFDRVYIHFADGGNLVVAPREQVVVERDRTVTS